MHEYKTSLKDSTKLPRGKQGFFHDQAGQGSGIPGGIARLPRADGQLDQGASRIYRLANYPSGEHPGPDAMASVVVQPRQIPQGPIRMKRPWPCTT